MRIKYIIGCIMLLILITSCTPKTIVSIEEFERSEKISATIFKQYQPVRNYGYGNLGDKLFNIDDIFKNLDNVPEEFYKYKYLLMTGRIEVSTLCGLDATYYEQPEFYGNSFKDVAISFYKNVDTSHWTPEGYGTFPHEMETITYAGESFDVCTFFHSSWGVETYQGFSLNPIYLKEIRHQGKSVNVNSDTTRRHITVTIEPSDIVITPSYPLFQHGWSKKVRMNVDVAEDTPPGIYAIGFDVGRPSLESSRIWQNQYAENYFVKSGFSISQPQFKMVIVVE